MIEHLKGELSLRRQCELLGVNRSRMYYQERPVDDQDVKIMNEMIGINTQMPFYGYRRMNLELAACGYKINHKKTHRLMQQTGLKALYPKKKTTIQNQAHKKYPYLLRDLIIDRPNQAWSVDITYIKIRNGYVYLVCLIDVFSRKIMGWRLSPYLDTQASLDALEDALKIGTPEIVNSDQGCQYTSDEWTTTLIEKNIKISMDGKGRWADNIYIERFWRSLKYESLYLHSFETVVEAREVLGRYIVFYNQRRFHQALAYKTPDSVYMGYQNQGRQDNVLSRDLTLETVLPKGLTMGGVADSQIQTIFWS